VEWTSNVGLSATQSLEQQLCAGSNPPANSFAYFDGIGRGWVCARSKARGPDSNAKAATTTNNKLMGAHRGFGGGESSTTTKKTVAWFCWENEVLWILNGERDDQSFLSPFEQKKTAIASVARVVAIQQQLDTQVPLDIPLRK